MTTRLIKYADQHQEVDLSYEEQNLIGMIMHAAEIAFHPNRPHHVTKREVVNLCCGLVTFLKEAEIYDSANLGLSRWRTRIENLRITLEKEE